MREGAKRTLKNLHMRLLCPALTLRPTTATQAIMTVNAEASGGHPPEEEAPVVFKGR